MPLRVWLLLALVLTANSLAVASDSAGIEFFESRIRPIFSEHCYSCHSAQAKRIEGGLRLDSPAALLKGGDSGPIVTPGKPETSSLIAAVTYSPDGVNMPPQGKLGERVIADLRKWVALGAPLPATREEATP